MVEHATALADYDRIVRATLASVAVTDAHHADAARMTRLSTSGLTEPNALHLAIAAANRLTLATCDHWQAKAGSDLAVPTLLL